MRYYYTPIFKKKLDKLKKSNSILGKKIVLTIKEFSLNPQQNSLRLHKLKGKKCEFWSLSVDKSIRVIFLYVTGGIILHNFGKHEEVY